MYLFSDRDAQRSPAIPIRRTQLDFRPPFGLIPPRIHREDDERRKRKGKGKARTQGGTRITVREASPPAARDSVSDSRTPQSTVVYRANAPVTSTSDESDSSCCFCCTGVEGSSDPRRDQGDSRSLSSPDQSFDSDDEQQRRPYFSPSPSQSSSSSSSVPSLSPSRPPLFDDDSGDEDDFPLSPPSRGPSPSSSSPSSLSQRRRTFTPIIVTTDPLISPPSIRADDPFAALLSKPHSAKPSPSSPPSSRRPISLLTKSLRSLTRLPNLVLPALPPLLSLPQTFRVPLAGIDLAGLEVLEESPWDWRGSRPGMRVGEVGWGGKRVRKAGVEGGYKRTSKEESEPTMVVQLQTFSPPKAQEVIDIVLPPSLVVTPPPSPPPPRLISNQRHLLMLSLEISMMREGKIVSPLRQRSVVVRTGAAPTIGGGRRESVLRWECCV